MKTRQKTIRCFEFESGKSAQEYIDYIAKNMPLLKYHMLTFKGEIEPSLEAFLKQNSLSFMFVGDSLENLPKPPQAKQSITPQQDKSSTLFIDKVIRSGEEISHSGDIVVYGQVNAGARICSGGNLVLLGECSGSVECNGEYLLCHKIFANALFFQESVINADFLHKINKSNAKLKIIRRIGNDIVIKDL